MACDKIWTYQTDLKIIKKQPLDSSKFYFERILIILRPLIRKANISTIRNSLKPLSKWIEGFSEHTRAHTHTYMSHLCKTLISYLGICLLNFIVHVKSRMQSNI